MHYGAHSGEPSHVVPHDAEASHAVDIEVVHAEVVEREHIVVAVARRVLVSERHRHGRRRQPVACEHPVIGISARGRQVGILDFLRLQVAVHASRRHILAQPVSHGVVQLVPIYLQRVLRIAHSAEPRTRRAPLYGALAECGGVGESPMVEDIIEVEALDAHVDAVEVDVLKRMRIDGIARVEARARNLVVAACLAVEQVDAEDSCV